MPIPTPRKGKTPESKSQFVSRCVSAIYDEYKDHKGQAVAICLGAWKDHVAKASYVISTAADEYAYHMVTRALPPALVAKMKTLPESGPGYHKVRATFKGTLSCVRGTVKGCDTFETDEDMPDNEFMDIQLDD